MQYMTAVAESIIQMFGQAVTVGVGAGLLTTLVYVFGATALRWWRIRRGKKEASIKRATEEASQVQMLLQLYGALGVPNPRSETALEQAIPLAVRETARAAYLREIAQAREEASRPKDISAWRCIGCWCLLTGEKGAIAPGGDLCVICTAQLNVSGRVVHPTQPDWTTLYPRTNPAAEFFFRSGSISQAEEDEEDEEDAEKERETEGEEERLDGQFYDQVDRIHEEVARKQV